MRLPLLSVPSQLEGDLLDCIDPAIDSVPYVSIELLPRRRRHLINRNAVDFLKAGNPVLDFLQRGAPQIPDTF